MLKFKSHDLIFLSQIWLGGPNLSDPLKSWSHLSVYKFFFNHSPILSSSLGMDKIDLSPLRITPPIPPPFRLPTQQKPVYLEIIHIYDALKF
ncbi:hypothetical protein BpHYR1_029014 [Brachionus plicatilis]|uniref:Uncharacterized protein n=1 Tax=Brachionus plicatilis TaxID=10195 RepID=A0A3M7SW87_BRAPC|nr:hypothetical protein BpHYR1_029014 [Brachionus plicatilis]